MRRVITVLLFGLGALWAAPAAAQRHDAPPVVVELFTSQGCAACVDANAFVGELAERDGVLALSFSVDYWDYLGWRDTFATPAAAQRQRAYSRRLNLRRLYTPQVVVDGRDAAPGFDHERIEAAVRRNADPASALPEIRLSADARRVWVGSGRAPRGGGDVWLVRYEPRTREVAVDQGENRGRTVRVVNVVRSVARVGGWRGRAMAVRLPAAEEGQRTAVLLQGVDGGPVLSAAVGD